MTAAANGDPVRVATFNVENLGVAPAQGGGLAERVRLLRPQLLRLRADILCLQEVDSQRRSKGAERRLNAMQELLADTPYEGFHQLATRSRSRGGLRDKHNLVILSRFPLAAHRQICHDLVAPLAHRPIADAAAGGERQPIEWDRPFLYAAARLAGGRLLHVVNVHLRAPRAAFIPGAKTNARSWRSMAGWAEGFFLAAVKRSGQALEVRLFVDGLFDADPEALIVVCGDFNADAYQAPVRIIRGDEEDAGNPHLTLRTLVPLERSLASSRRFSVVHHGRPQMLDHLLVSRPLLAWYRGVEIHNEALGDELITPQAVSGSPESFHAPVVAEFRLDAASASAP
ncbi:MAG: endonuclease/exonuclease/phosphatase family protein [Rhodospirillales bacterium]